LMWWKLKRHRLAVVSGAFLLMVYLSIVVSEMLAPYDLQARHTDMDTAIMQARISGKSLYRVLAGPIGKSDLTAARRTLSKGGVRHSWAVRLCKATLTPTPCVSSVQQASLR
ncbi:MAG: hypothetical protein HOI19_13065, partial [Rhodospirillaceae bacterium]|nr:hypothetical protein [Rhodospirillaceae bacterium]